MFGKEALVGTSSLIESTFELIEEQEEIDIQEKEDLLIEQLKDREHTNADIYALGVRVKDLLKWAKQIDKKIKEM